MQVSKFGNAAFKSEKLKLAPQKCKRYDQKKLHTKKNCDCQLEKNIRILEY